MAFTQMDQEKVAQRLYQAWSSKMAIPSLAAEFPAMTIEEAYKISEMNLARRVKEKNTQMIGRKIGLTSDAVQSWLKVSQPDFGFVTKDMQYDEGAVIPTSSFIAPRIEAEVAFVLKRDLKGPGVGRSDIFAAIDYAAPALEIIDSRIKDWKITIQDTVADNASSGVFVLGKERFKAESFDFRVMGMKMEKNGEVVSTGAGAACLGGPAIAVAWLVNTLGALGISIKKGEIILSGALGPVTEVKPGDRIKAFMRGLGTASCLFN